MKSLNIFNCKSSIFVLVGLAFFVTACAEEREQVSAVKPPVEYKALGNNFVFVDSETGCQYISSSSSYTPRLNSNGIPICRNTGIQQ